MYHLHAPHTDCDLPGFNSTLEFGTTPTDSCSYLETSFAYSQTDCTDASPQSCTYSLLPSENSGPVPSVSFDGYDELWWANSVEGIDRSLDLQTPSYMTPHSDSSSMCLSNNSSPDHSLSGPLNDVEDFAVLVPTPGHNSQADQHLVDKAEATLTGPKKTRKKRVTKPVDCSICGLSFEKPCQLREHSRGHENQYECETCGRTFAERRTLSLHMKKHQTIPQPCKKCSKSFTKLATLRTHLKSHETDRQKLACPYEGCDREYVDRGGLNRHVKEHDAELVYPCGGCHRMFKRRHGLERHEKNNCKVARETRLAEEEDNRAQAQQSQGMNQPSSKKQPSLIVHPHVGESPQQHLQQWTDPTQIAWSEAISLNETVRIGEQAFMTPDLAFGLEQLQMQQSTYFADANLQEHVVPLEFMMDGIFFENGFGQQDLWELGPEIQSCF